MKNRSSVYNVVMIIALTSLAKLIGFARDIFIPYSIGAEISDIYLAAISLTTILFLGIGSAITTTIIPIIVRNRDSEEGMRGINSILTSVILLTLAGSLLYYFMAPVLMPLLLPGYTAERLSLTVDTIRIMVPTLLLICLMYFFVGALQAGSRFLRPATSSYLFNFLFFVYLLIFAKDFGIIGLAVATTLGWGLQMLYLLPEIRKHRIIHFRWQLDLNSPQLKEFFISILPIMLVTLTHQVSMILDNQQATYFGETNLSALYYGNMLFVAVTTITVTGITAVMFPKFNEKLHEDNHEGFYQSVVNVLRSVILLLVPMSVGMILVGPHVIHLIFDRGTLEGGLSHLIVTSFVGYTSLMLAFGFVEVLNKAYYALGNRKIPVMVGVIITTVNLGLNLLLPRFIGFAGIPIATSIAYFVGGITSFTLFYRLEKGFKLDRFLNTLYKVLMAAAAMGGGVLIVDHLITGRVASLSYGFAIIILLDVLMGILFYGLVLLLVKEQLIYHNLGKMKQRLFPGGSKDE